MLFFAKKRCFFRLRFPDRFFYRILTPPGPSQTLKIKQNHCSVARNQGFLKIKRGDLGEAFLLDFGPILEPFFDIFVICCVFFLRFDFLVILCGRRRLRAEGPAALTKLLKV